MRRSSARWRASVAGIKDTTCTLEGIRAKQQVAGDAVVYQANTPFLVDALASGVRGIMAITSTVRPDWVLQLWHGFQAGADVRALHRELVILDTLLELGYPASAKYLDCAAWPADHDLYACPSATETAKWRGPWMSGLMAPEHGQTAPIRIERK